MHTHILSHTRIKCKPHVKVITLVEATKPAKPVKPNATNVGYRNVTLSWAKPASDIPITSYIVKYRQDGKGEPMVTTIEPAEGQTEPPTGLLKSAVVALNSNGLK